MKKLIRKIWGVGLVVVLLTSLLVAALPVAAGNLTYSEEYGPGTAWTTYQLASGTNIVDMAIANDGTTIYAVDGVTAGVYKSTNAGVTWALITMALTTPLKVAVAPDNPSLVATANATAAYVSQTGGTFMANTNLTGFTAINDSRFHRPSARTTTSPLPA